MDKSLVRVVFLSITLACEHIYQGTGAAFFLCACYTDVSDGVERCLLSLNRSYMAMSYFLWIVGSLIAYIGGLVVILRVTPRLLASSYDEGLFMGIAALDILGALLAFGAVVITFALFNGAIGVRVLDFLFLFGILLVGLRMAWMSYRPRLMARTFYTSRIITGVYCLCLAIAAIYYIIRMFTPA
jgi:hypothetical protein